MPTLPVLPANWALVAPRLLSLYLSCWWFEHRGRGLGLDVHYFSQHDSPDCRESGAPLSGCPRSSPAGASPSPASREGMRSRGRREGAR